ncbi:MULTISPECIES: hypothetical protein [unclassified Micromonospora]|uniref:hypothetical protein n=1 Tax=unclassified Micromonospora TaxID=2617518 RepID=UPI00363CC7BA
MLTCRSWSARAQGRTSIAGLYAGRPATSGNLHTIPQPTPLQLELLDLLDVNPLEWC